jgi:hypothetical protein
MAELDASINEYTPTELLADRVEVYRLAVRLIREAGYDSDATQAEDVLQLTHFLCGEIY